VNLKITYDLRKDYLYVLTTGEFDLISARDVFHQWVDEAKQKGVKRILCDITQVTGLDVDQASTATRFDINSYIAEKIPSQFRLAVLTKPNQISDDNFEENVLINRGAHAKVTSDMKEALSWLEMSLNNEIKDT